MIWLGVALLAFAGISRADTFSNFNLSAAACGYDTNCNSGTTTGTSLTVVSPDGTVTVNASVNSFTATYGALAASTSGDALPGPDPIRAISDVTATVGFNDLVTIFGGTGQGQLSYTASIIGNIDYLSGKGGSYYLTQVNIPTTFTFGVPFEIGAQLFARSDAFFGGTGEDASLTITSLSVSDANSNLLSGYTFTDASETKYAFVNGSFASTPDAPTGFLLLAGLCVLGIVMRVRG
ncbi:MAG TPA: hypothetical protein VKT53_00265 [Candidatus Acidoferrum sp.]|nr:hypothetical protein [Candidatus Acidoferrum sp.]